MNKLTITTFLFLFLLNTSSYLLAEDKQKIIFSEGVTDTYQSEAIAYGLFNELSYYFKYFVQESHFIYGDKKIDFQVKFKTASVDVNLDGQDEVFVTLDAHGACGSGGCTTYLLEKRTKKNSELNDIDDSWEWKEIGSFFGHYNFSISPKENHGYLSLDSFSKNYKYECYYKKNLDKYECNNSVK